MTNNDKLKEAVKSDEHCKNCSHDKYWNTSGKCTKCGTKHEG